MENCAAGSSDGRSAKFKLNMQHINLHIDTTDTVKTTLTIEKNGVTTAYSKQAQARASQQVLPLIEEALKAEKLTFKDITQITVNAGPGSFTGTRVGVAVANTLGWVLGIPVNGQKIVTPTYEPSKFDN